MSSNTVTARTGQLNFNVVHIDPSDIASAFQKFVDNGSKLTGVSLDDIDTNVLQVPSNLAAVTLADLLVNGMALFDAVVWMQAGKPTTHPLTQSLTLKKEDIPSLQEISKAVFYSFFFLLTQARYPASENERDPPTVSNFLKVVMGLDAPQHVYIKRICHFNAKAFDPKWIRWVRFEGLGQEALSRFGLGVAGYRMFAPFKTYVPKEGTPQELLNAVAFAKTVATAPVSWDIHPVTRHPNVLTKRGNLNKNLSNLMLDVYTQEQLQEMFGCKMIYSIPKRVPGYIDYKTWKAEDDISGTAAIFPANPTQS